MGTYHLQGKTGNYNWKIKSVVAQFRLGPREAPENTGKSVQLICMYYLWVVLPPPQILQFHVYADDFQPGGLCKWQATKIKVNDFETRFRQKTANDSELNDDSRSLCGITRSAS